MPGDGGRAPRCWSGTPTTCVALCHSREQAEQVKARLAAWLAPRGLAFNEDKTRDRPPRRGVRLPRVQRPPLPRQAADQAEQGGRAGGSGNGSQPRCGPARGQRAAVIARLNPIIRGWAAYYRGVVSSKAFATLDDYLWKLTYKWARCSHTEQAEALDRRPVLRQVQQVQAATGGCSATATAAPTCSSSPGPPSSGTSWSRARRPPTTPPWPATGPGDGARSHPRRTAPACGSTGSAGAARSAGTAAARRPPATKPTRVGTVADRHPQGDHQRSPRGRTARRTRPDPPHTRLLPAPTHGRQRAGAPARPRAFRACLSRVRGDAHARF